MTSSERERFKWADRLVRSLVSEKCLNPVTVGGDPPIDCGEVYLCGGMCASCAAIHYVERYAHPVSGERNNTDE